MKDITVIKLSMVMFETKTNKQLCMGPLTITVKSLKFEVANILLIACVSLTQDFLSLMNYPTKFISYVHTRKPTKLNFQYQILNYPNHLPWWCLFVPTWGCWGVHTPSKTWWEHRSPAVVGPCRSCHIFMDIQNTDQMSIFITTLRLLAHIHFYLLILLIRKLCKLYIKELINNYEVC